MTALRIVAFHLRRHAWLALFWLPLVLLLPSAVPRAMPSFFSITEPASGSDLDQFSYVVGPLRREIPQATVKVLRTAAFVALRFEECSYCVRDSCPTYLIAVCEHVQCAFASVLAGPKFMLADEFIFHFGGAAYLAFSKGARTIEVVLGRGLVAVH
jgi:hypothetical protein